MPQRSFSANSIGILVGLDLVGDALIKLPFLRALRAAYPQAAIHWITTKGPTAYASILRNVTRGLIDEVWETPDWIAATVSNQPPPPAPSFDLLIDTRNRWKLALQAKRIIPHKLFLSPALRHLLSGRRPPLWQPKPPHMVDRLLQMVELAAGYTPPATGRLPVPPELLAKARQILPEGPDYIGLAPGAGNPVKIWPRHKFAQLAMAQAARGRIPVFLLGPQELDWQDELQHKVSSAKFPLQEQAIWQTAQVTIEQTLAIGSCLKLAVANDSGTGHMLAAVDCPLVSLFGPTSPAKLAPKVSHGLIIKAQDYGGISMDYIPWEAVDRQIENFVSRL